MISSQIEIQHLGALGDGVGYLEGQHLFVPLALPGEQWLADGNGGFTCLSPAADRASPTCGHFPVCGGCRAQHMPERTYRAWKTGIVRQALGRHGITCEPKELIMAAQGGRRRCVLTVRKDRAGHVELGYHRARSHDLIAIAECPVLVPEIVEALPGLRDLVCLALPRAQQARLTIVKCQQGLDVNIGNIRIDTAPGHRASLAELAKKLNLVRLSNEADTLVMQALPVIRLGEVSVPLPKATLFLQAVEAAEQVLRDHVVAATQKAKHVADLFSGVGTFTFALARHARVLAADSDKDALGALEMGRDGMQGLKPITVLVRDLFREPLSRKELEPFDAVVFDPPRAGAEAQACMLAKSSVPVVVAVSCNPGTLARDIALLMEGGYQLDSVQPVDQFLYSAHVECVAVLSRKNKKERRR